MTISSSCAEQSEHQVSTEQLTYVQIEMNEEYHLSDSNITEYHKFIYDNAKFVPHPKDNIVLSIIDSLDSKYNHHYHFVVFTKSLNGSDGYYFEGAGKAAYNYVKENTKKFASLIASSSELNEIDFSNWANAILGEIQIEFEGDETIEILRYGKEIQSKVKESSEVNRNIIDTLIDIMNIQWKERNEKTAP